jgi:hypothetical protein
MRSCCNVLYIGEDYIQVCLSTWHIFNLSKGELVVGGSVSEPLRQQDTVHTFFLYKHVLK